MNSSTTGRKKKNEMAPSPPSPPMASPQVVLRMAEERLTASTGPTPSTTSTGTTK